MQTSHGPRAGKAEQDLYQVLWAVLMLAAMLVIMSYGVLRW